MGAGSVSKHLASGGDDTHVRVCSTTRYCTIGHTCQWTGSTSHSLPFTFILPYQYPMPVPPDLVSLSIFASSVRALPLPHHIGRSYDDDDACRAPLSGPTCVSLLFHAAGDARSAVAVGSSRPFQAIICVTSIQRQFFENNTLQYTVPVSLREMILLHMIHRSKKHAITFRVLRVA